MVGISNVGFGTSHLESARAAQSRSLERLASGNRVNKAADDAARLATVQQFLAIEASVSQGAQNLSDGVSAAAIAEGALGESSEILGRMRELSVQAQNGTLTDGDRAAIQGEFDALSEELTRIAESTEFNGTQLLDGSIAGNAGISLEDGTSADNVKLSIDGSTAGQLGLAGLDASSASSIHALDAAIGAVSSSRAGIGTTQRRLGHQIDNLGTTRENVASARSRIGDTDFAQEATDFVRNSILEKASTKIFVRNVQARQQTHDTLLNLLG